MINRRDVLVAAGCWCASLGAATGAPKPFVLTIARKFKGSSCTSGYLAADGQIICYTLERSWQGNKTDLSSIPVGEYQATVRYDHPDKWRIELNVPGRPNIQIHTGNETDQTKGCILVGLSLTSDLCGIVGGTSKPAYDKLRTAFYGTPNPVSTPNKSIKVKVEE